MMTIPPAPLVGAFQPALDDIVTLARLLTPAEWAAVVLGVGLAVYVLAMLRAFIANDSRPTLNQRCATEVEEARR